MRPPFAVRLLIPGACLALAACADEAKPKKTVDGATHSPGAASSTAPNQSTSDATTGGAPSEATPMGSGGAAAPSEGPTPDATGGSGPVGGGPVEVGGTGAGGQPAGGAGAAAPVGGSAGGSGFGGSTAGSGGAAAGAGGAPPLEGDRCDVAVYDPEAPPQTLSLSGNLGVHDPVVMEEDGRFYLFATGNEVAAKTSTDLLRWDAAPEVFQQVSRPSWIAQRVPGVSNLWAPDISRFGGQYHLYYSASTFGENTSCIGHLTRESLSSGQWEAEDEPTICTTGTEDYNAIDPNVVLDLDGTPWLSFGSWWDGIRIFELDQQGRRVNDELHAIASRGGAGIEAPFIVRRCGYYYLFTSWDRCCQGTSSTYNIRVGRSAEVLGPYEDQSGQSLLDGGGTLLVEGDDHLHGPGHNAILFVGNQAYNVYHAYPNNGGQLRISELAWDEAGWPISAGP